MKLMLPKRMIQALALLVVAIFLVLALVGCRTSTRSRPWCQTNSIESVAHRC